MIYVIMAVVLFLSWGFGVFAFSQIIGCIRTRSHLGAFLFWSALVVIASVLVTLYAPDYMYAYYIGLAVSFLRIVTLPNIE